MSEYNADLDPNKMIPRTAYAALTTERDALRAALEEIAEPADGNDHQNHCHAQRKRARQALAGQPERERA